MLYGSRNVTDFQYTIGAQLPNALRTADVSLTGES